MDPIQALEEMDRIVQQVNLSRKQHAFLLQCKQVVLERLTKPNDDDASKSS